MPPRMPPPKRRHANTTFGLVPIIICAPSGGGKTTVAKRLLKEFSDCVGPSISHTTRAKKPDEAHGKDYFFVDKSTMEVGIRSGQFLEYTTYAGNYYGTSKKDVEAILQSGKLCLLCIDIQGCELLRQTCMKAKYIFLMPPSMEVLRSRQLNRDYLTEEDIDRRMDTAIKEIEYAKTPGKFDLVVENDDFEVCYSKIVEYLMPHFEAIRNKAARMAQFPCTSELQGP